MQKHAHIHSDEEDHESIEALYSGKVGKDLRNFCRSKSLNTEDTEDFIQETFTRLLEQTQHTNEENKIDNLGGYAYTICKHLHVDHLKKEEKQYIHESISDDLKPQLLHEEGLMDTTFAAKLHDRIDREKFEKHIKACSQTLSKAESEILSLHLEGYSKEEIAEELHLDIYRVRYEVNKVMAKFRARLKARVHKGKK